MALGKSLVCDWIPKTPACDSRTPTRVSRWGGSLVFNLLGLCPSIVSVFKPPTYLSWGILWGILGRLILVLLWILGSGALLPTK